MVTRPQPNMPATPVAHALAQARLLALLATYPIAGRQIHDANIVATMLANGINRQLTCSVVDFRRFTSLITAETL